MSPIPTPGFSSDAYTYDDLIAGDGQGLVTEIVTLTDISGTGALTRGTVLGQVTADSKFGISLSASVDGSEVAKAILAEDADPSSGDVEAVIYRAGEFNDNKLTIGTGHTLASIRESLADQSIYLKAPTKTAT